MNLTVTDEHDREYTIVSTSHEVSANQQKSWIHAQYSLANPDGSIFSAGELVIEELYELGAGHHLIAMQALLRGLYEEVDRLMYPHRYDAPHDRGLQFDPKVHQWLRIDRPNFEQLITGLSSMSRAVTAYRHTQYYVFNSVDGG